jgi:hypothetical protein
MKQLDILAMRDHVAESFHAHETLDNIVLPLVHSEALFMNDYLNIFNLQLPEDITALKKGCDSCHITLGYTHALQKHMKQDHKTSKGSTPQMSIQNPNICTAQYTFSR